MKATPSIGEMSIAVLVSKIAAIGPMGVPAPVDGSAYWRSSPFVMPQNTPAASYAPPTSVASINVSAVATPVVGTTLRFCVSVTIRSRSVAGLKSIAWRFDGTSTFSGLKNLVTTSGLGPSALGTPVVAWPTFLPDGKSIVYHVGDAYDSSTYEGYNTTPSKARYAELNMVDTETGTIKKLAALNGRNAEGASILPYGEVVENERGSLVREPRPEARGDGGPNAVDLLEARGVLVRSLAQEGGDAAEPAVARWDPCRDPAAQVESGRLAHLGDAERIEDATQRPRP